MNSPWLYTIVLKETGETLCKDASPDVAADILKIPPDKVSVYYVYGYRSGTYEISRVMKPKEKEIKKNIEVVQRGNFGEIAYVWDYVMRGIRVKYNLDLAKWDELKEKIGVEEFERRKQIVRSLGY